MALKIRLRMHGNANHSVYRLVVTDSKQPRDGKYIEVLGWYNPMANDEDQQFSINADRIQYWMGVGAQPSETVVPLLKKAAPSLVADYHSKRLKKTQKKAAQARKIRKSRKAA